VAHVPLINSNSTVGALAHEPGIEHGIGADGRIEESTAAAHAMLDRPIRPDGSSAWCLVRGWLVCSDCRRSPSAGALSRTGIKRSPAPATGAVPSDRCP